MMIGCKIQYYKIYTCYICLYSSKINELQNSFCKSPFFSWPGSENLRKRLVVEITNDIKSVKSCDEFLNYKPHIGLQESYL